MVPGAAVSEPRPELRAKLTELRRAALASLDEAAILDPGLMRLIADTGAVLAAIAEADEPGPVQTLASPLNLQQQKNEADR